MALRQDRHWGGSGPLRPKCQMDEQGYLESDETQREQQTEISVRAANGRPSRRMVDQGMIERAVVREVAPRLLENVGDDEASIARSTAPPSFPAANQDALIALLLDGDVPAMRNFATVIDASELSLTEACTGIFIPVAETLGTMWCDDRVNFVDVTLALSRLQSMVQAFASRRSLATARPPAERRIILARAPGEDHVFGLVVLGLYFDSAGWEVSGGSDVEAGELLCRELRYNDFGVLGLSVGSQANTSELREIVKEARTASRNPRLRIAVGGAAIRADTSLCERVGADFFANDANEAIEKAEAIVA